MWIFLSKSTEIIAFDTAKENIPHLGRKTTGQVYSVSGNALEGKKCLQDLSKDLAEYDFTMKLP